MLIATLIAYFSKDDTSIEINKTPIDTDIIKKLVFVFVAIILSGVFWASYEMSAGTTSYYWSQTDNGYSILNTIISSSGIVFTLILAIIWTFVYTNQFSKFCVGLIISALAISLLISYPENLQEGNSTILILSSLLLALGETFISPMLYAITTRYANPKYLAIFLSLVSLPIMIFYKIAVEISELTFDYNPSGIFIAVTSALVFFGIIAFIMWFVQKRDYDNLVSQNEIIE